MRNILSEKQITIVSGIVWQKSVISGKVNYDKYFIGNVSWTRLADKKNIVLQMEFSAGNYK